MSSPDLPRRLSTLDALFLHLERPSQPLHIASLLIFEGALDYERILVDLRAHLPLISRYTDRLMPAPLGLAHPTWEPDPEFDLRAHVHHRTLSLPGTDEQLAEFCSSLYRQPLRRGRPLWELYVIDGYRGDDGTSWRGGAPFTANGRARSPRAERSGRSALFFKVHHSMIDGVSGVQLIEALLDAHPRPPAVSTRDFDDRPRLPGFTTRLAAALSDRVTTGVSRAVGTLALLGHPRRAARELGSAADAIGNVLKTALGGAPQTPLGAGVGKDRGLAWVRFSLNEMKAIKNRLGGSVNDVVLAVVSGALRRVLEGHGINPDRLELRAIVPVNVRGAGEHLRLGNHISMMVAPLPVGILDPGERLHQVRAATALLKKGNEPARMERIVQMASLLPPSMQRLFSRGLTLRMPVNTICTNVPGPPVALYMQGVRVELMTPFVPLVKGLGVVFATLSYADTLTMGITADPSVVPDLRDIVAPLRASFEELWSATGLSRAQAMGPIWSDGQNLSRLAI